jgi:hypothetical protein
MTDAGSTPAEPVPPPPRFPSMDLLLQVAMQERDKQLAHFDALDTKAGVLLAFDGVLIVVAHGIEIQFLVPGIILAAASAVASAVVAWPRKYAALDPWGFRPFLTYDAQSTGLRVHDTTAMTVRLGWKVLRRKALLLKLAMVLLFAAVLVLGAGTAYTAASANSGGTHHGVQRHVRPPAGARVSPSQQSSPPAPSAS